MRFRLLELLPILVVLAVPAQATPDNWAVFKKYYRLAPGSANFKAECKNCHTQVPAHNPFGRDVRSAARAAGLETITPAILASLEDKDSDGDGWLNGDEIRRGFMPGDPESRPSGIAHKHPPSVQSSTPPKESWLDSWLPKHSLHPLVVHFPIALFIFGAGLEFVGWRRRVEPMRQAGWWCVLFGALSTFLAVGTGLLAFFRNGFLWQGTALLHFIFAVSATVLMTATVLWRRKGAHESLAYFLLLLLATALVAFAGHFGADLVYGT